MKNLQFFVVGGEDALWSRYGDQVVYSSLLYHEGYECALALESLAVSNNLHYLVNGKGRWTKKVPAEWKNVHRKFWGLAPLKEESILPEWYIDEVSIWVPTPENAGDLPAALNEWMTSCDTAQHKHWYGHRDCFKTWVFSAPLEVVKTQVAPLIEGTNFVAKLKSW